MATWYFVEALTDEECCVAGGRPAAIECESFNDKELLSVDVLDGVTDAILERIVADHNALAAYEPSALEWLVEAVGGVIESSAWINRESRVETLRAAMAAFKGES